MKNQKKKKSNAASRANLDELPVKALNKMLKHKSFAFYGKAGTGKTTTACTFPQPIVLFDLREHGTDSVEEYELDEVAGLPVNNWEELQEYYYYLKYNPKKYATVILDTMTQAQQLCIEHVMDGKKLKSGKAIGDWGTMTKQDWGEVASLMKQLITNFRDLPMNVVFLAQERVFNVEEEDATDGMLAPEVGARLSPSVVAHLNASVNVLGQTYIRVKEIKKEVNGKKKYITKTQYCLRVGPNDVYMTKFRKPKDIVLPDMIINPDYDKIMDILKGE